MTEKKTEKPLLPPHLIFADIARLTAQTRIKEYGSMPSFEEAIMVAYGGALLLGARMALMQPEIVRFIVDATESIVDQRDELNAAMDELNRRLAAWYEQWVREHGHD